MGDPLDLSRRYRTPVPAGPGSVGRANLSRRQHEVLALLAEGVTARGIAALLDLAEPTVRNHIRAVLRKLDCHSQLEAVAVAVRLDLVQVRGPAGDGPERAHRPASPAQQQHGGQRASRRGRARPG
ncbi:MAG: helix-turn-helix transcriptional regulator [Thermoleophilia bacterium]|nr:helix-turn-helix transcriptional regulator [Thermoleophilia bacterium]